MFKFKSFAFCKDFVKKLSGVFFTFFFLTFSHYVFPQEKLSETYSDCLPEKKTEIYLTEGTVIINFQEHSDEKNTIKKNKYRKRVVGNSLTKKIQNISSGKVSISKIFYSKKYLKAKPESTLFSIIPVKRCYIIPTQERYNKMEVVYAMGRISGNHNTYMKKCIFSQEAFFFYYSIYFFFPIRPPPKKNLKFN